MEVDGGEGAPEGGAGAGGCGGRGEFSSVTHTTGRSVSVAGEQTLTHFRCCFL